jgi:hypothetical protein
MLTHAVTLLAMLDKMAKSRCSGYLLYWYKSTNTDQTKLRHSTALSGAQPLEALENGVCMAVVGLVDGD